MNGLIESQNRSMDSLSELGSLVGLSYQNLCTELGIYSPNSHESNLVSPLEVIVKSNLGFMKNAETMLLAYAQGLGRKMAKAVCHQSSETGESGAFVIEVQCNQAYAGKKLNFEKAKKIFSLPLSSLAASTTKREGGVVDFFSRESQNYTIVDEEQFEVVFTENEIVIGTVNPDFVVDQGLFIFGSHLDRIDTEKVKLINTSSQTPLQLMVERLSTGKTACLRVRVTEAKFLESMRKQELSGKSLYCFSLRLSDGDERTFRVDVAPNCIVVEEGIFITDKAVEAQMTDDLKFIIPLTDGHPRGRISLTSQNLHGESSDWQQVEDVTFHKKRDKVFEYNSGLRSLCFPLSSEFLRDVHSHVFSLKNVVFSKGQDIVDDVVLELQKSSEEQRQAIYPHEDFRVKGLRLRSYANSYVARDKSKSELRNLSGVPDEQFSFKGNSRPLITLQDYESFCVNSFHKVSKVFSKVSEKTQCVELCLLGPQELTSSKVNDFEGLDGVAEQCKKQLKNRMPAGVKVEFKKFDFKDIRVSFRVELKSTGSSEKEDFSKEWSRFFRPLGFADDCRNAEDQGYYFCKEITIEEFRAYLGSLKSIRSVKNVEWVDAKTLKKITALTPGHFEIIRIDPKIDLAISGI